MHKSYIRNVVCASLVKWNMHPFSFDDNLVINKFKCSAYKGQTTLLNHMHYNVNIN